MSRSFRRLIPLAALGLALFVPHTVLLADERPLLGIQIRPTAGAPAVFELLVMPRGAGVGRARTAARAVVTEEGVFQDLRTGAPYRLRPGRQYLIVPAESSEQFVPVPIFHPRRKLFAEPFNLRALSAAAPAYDFSGRIVVRVVEMTAAPLLAMSSSSSSVPGDLPKKQCQCNCSMQLPPPPDPPMSLMLCAGPYKLEAGCPPDRQYHLKYVQWYQSCSKLNGTKCSGYNTHWQPDGSIDGTLSECRPPGTPPPVESSSSSSLAGSSSSAAPA